MFPAFVGPSYQLTTRKADAQRTVNMFVQVVESGSGKAPAILRSVPGLKLFAPLGGEIRGAAIKEGRAFFVSGSGLWEITGGGGATKRGDLDSSSGNVGMAVGISQLVVVDGANGYVFNLDTSAYTPITDEAFYGSPRVDYLNGRFYFTRPGTGQFYASDIEDALHFDATYFATAERSPDALIAHIVDHGELLLFGSKTVEVWSPADTGDNIPVARNDSAVIEVGCVAPFSIQRLNNTVLWLGADMNGSVGVYQMNGYQPTRITTWAIEEKLQDLTLSKATAYTYQKDGGAFYCLRVPGLETTWVYNAFSQQWHEQADMKQGKFVPHRGICHLYVWGKHVVGGIEGNLYEMRDDVYTLNGDPLVRERTSPHSAAAGYEPVAFPEFELDVSCDAPNGIDPHVEMRYSNDGGRTWGNWLARSLGKIGEYGTRVRWLRLGQGRDRIWCVRCSDPVPFSIVSANVRAT